MFSGFSEILLAHRRSRETFTLHDKELGRDRRVFRRIPVKAACRLSNPVFGLESAGMTVDISLDGLGLMAPVNWSEGNRIHMWLDPAGFEADGIIVFRKEEAEQYRYGVRLYQTGFFELMKLRRFLRQTHHGPLTL